MSYKTVRKELAQQHDTNRGCRTCQAGAPHATLSDYGGLCFPCFQAYCREPSYDRGRSKAAERIRAEIAAMGRKVPV